MNTNPEHLHVMFNHLPLVGLLASVVPLGVGLIFKSRASLNAGLLLVVICAASTLLVMRSGEQAYERFEHDAALSAVLDEPGNGWMHEHEELAETASWVVYGTGLIGLIALGLSVKRAGKGRKLAMLTLAGVAASLVFLGQVADTGGQVRHPEFRAGFNAGNLAGTGPVEHDHDSHGEGGGGDTHGEGDTPDTDGHSSGDGAQEHGDAH